MPEPERESAGRTVLQDAIRAGSRCALVAVGIALLAGVVTDTAAHLPIMLAMIGLLATGAAVFGVLIALTMHADDLENDATDAQMLAQEMLARKPVLP